MPEVLNTHRPDQERSTSCAGVSPGVAFLLRLWVLSTAALPVDAVLVRRFAHDDVEAQRGETLPEGGGLPEDLHDVVLTAVVELTEADAGSGIIPSHVIQWMGCGERTIDEEHPPAGPQRAIDELPDGLETARWDMAEPEREEDHVVSSCWLPVVDVGHDISSGCRLGPIDGQGLLGCVQHGEASRVAGK